MAAVIILIGVEVFKAAWSQRSSQTGILAILARVTDDEFEASGCPFHHVVTNRFYFALLGFSFFHFLASPSFFLGRHDLVPLKQADPILHHY